MGDRLTGDEESEQTSPTPYGDIFDELFPRYLLFGMTPEQYWDGEVGLKRAYRKMYAMKIETEQVTADRMNWYMGQYLIAVLNAVPLLVAGLNVKKGASLPEYPDKPFLTKALEEKEESVRKKNEEDRTRLAMAMFQAGIEKFNKQFRKKQSDGKDQTGQ